MGIPPIYRVLLEKLAAPEPTVVQHKVRGRLQAVPAVPPVPAPYTPRKTPHAVARMDKRLHIPEAEAHRYLEEMKARINKATNLPKKFRLMHPSGGHTIWERYLDRKTGKYHYTHKTTYSAGMKRYENLKVLKAGDLTFGPPPRPAPFRIGGGPPRPPKPAPSLGTAPKVPGLRKAWPAIKERGLQKGRAAHLAQELQQSGKPSSWWGQGKPQSWGNLSRRHGMSSNKLRKLFRTMVGRGLVKVGAALQAYMLAMEKSSATKLSRVPRAVKMYRRALVSLRGGNLFHGTKPKRVAGIARSGTLPAFPGTHGKGVYMWRDGPRSTYMRRPDQPGVIMSRSRTKLGPTPKPPEGGVRGRFPERPYMAISSTPVKLPPKSYLSTTPEQLRAARQGMTKNRLRPMDSAIFHRAEADMAMGRIDPDMVKRPTKRDLVRLLRRKTQPKTVGMIRSKRTNQELNLLHGQYDRAVGREPLVDPKTGLFDYV